MRFDILGVGENLLSYFVDVMVTHLQRERRIFLTVTYVTTFLVVSILPSIIP